MRWTEITAPPSRKMLRQFAGLWLLFFVGMAAWRLWTGSGEADTWTRILLGVGLTGGIGGLLWPPALRWIYTGWMVAVFPIGWTISRLTLLAMFYVVFAPVALLFRVIGRDALRLRRGDAKSHWTVKPRSENVSEYLRQY